MLECGATGSQPTRSRYARRSDRTRLLLEVVARTPLRTWTDGFGLTAAQVVALPSGDWAPVTVHRLVARGDRAA